MSLNFTKRTYVDGETVITADNLNDIQDALLDLDEDKVDSSAVGAASGVASLDSSGKVPIGQLPVDSALSDSSTNPVQNKVVAAALDGKAPVIYDTASGAVASISDGADGMPIKSLVVNIEPVQAGSGDPSPENIRLLYGWTGGSISKAKKNLLHITNATNTILGVEFAKNAESGTVVLNGTPTGSQNPFGNLDYEPGQSKYPRGVPLRLSGAVEDVAIRVCYNTRASSATINLANCTTSNPDVVFSFPEEAYAMWIRVVAINNSREYVNVEVRPMVRVASDSDMTFSPFSGDSISISWASAAGTVYYGTIDIISGVLSARAAIFDMGDLTYTETSGGIRFDIIGGVGSGAQGTPAAFALCSAYKMYSDAIQTISQITLPNNNIVQTTASGARARYYIRDDRYTTAAAMKAGLSGVQFLCELREPITYQLTPQQVNTLLGVNNIWADCGSVKAVEYPADTKLYVQKINTPSDDDMTADTQIASGKYFIIGGSLYKSTTTIPAGDAIIPGTNCVQTNLAEALNALNA